MVAVVENVATALGVAAFEDTVVMEEVVVAVSECGKCNCIEG